ncbi:uncharacterized protein LOC120412439 [Culex pipiens pallens]|uniref:uncharacterized protein LOC120412439 n=1 Tax=Culex pipiens pallens TaxID=42434 RepID=UPI0022AAACD9|nr:uncharacterized protein LOC120412439 [Culex pipiens pallens]
MPITTRSNKTLSLKQLTTVFKQVKASMQDIFNFSADLEKSCTIADVEVRLGALDELWVDFNETLVEIQSHGEYVATEDATYEADRAKFSESYFLNKSRLITKSRELQAPPAVLEQTIRSEETSHGLNDHIRLPQIKLQKFTGIIEEWLSFRDLFVSLIHSKAELSDVEKFYYLRGCLDGKPAGLIDHLKITAESYTVAWTILLNEYDNDKLLKKRQIQSLFELPVITEESSSDLHTLVDGFVRIVQTLDRVLEEANFKDLLLVNILSSRLDSITRRAWEEYSAKDNDTLKDMTDFLQTRIRILESLPKKKADSKVVRQNQVRSKPAVVKASYNTAQESGGPCCACSGTHFLHQCKSFQQRTVSDREALLRTNSLCRNCLKSGHLAKDCSSRFSCRNCNKRHHTLLCFKSGKDKGSAQYKRDNSKAATDESQASGHSSSSTSNQVTPEITVSNSAQLFSTQVLLATAIVIIEDDEGNRLPARALLDSGSESNFISEHLSQRLRVRRNKVDISVSGIGRSVSKVKQQIRATLCSRVSNFSRDMRFLVLPKVTVSLPTSNINTAGWTIPDNVVLADPTFSVSKGVDMVLGIESFFDFFETGRKISLGEELPALNESVFGWVVCGGIADSGESIRITCNVSARDKLEALVTRFWSCEEVESGSSFSPEEARCEALFAQTVQRGADGRYSVALPKNEAILSKLGESRNIALRRLHGTERRLARDAHLQDQYTEFMDEYLRLGHMHKVEETDAVKRCYLPHHPVVREASTTTKVRVVFDASCKTSSGVSLNDALLCGPVIQQDLRSLIYRCRIKQIMLVSDVEKMFRQIGITPEDRALQCVLWRPTPSAEVCTYELNTVTYGTKSAPFLATRALKQLAMDEKHRFPLAAKAISEDVYMDDVITGMDDEDAAHNLRIQLDEMMISGGFRLRKWACNRAEVLRGVAEENLAIPLPEGINLDKESSVKTLGLTWIPNTDEFKVQFDITPTVAEDELCKRVVLSKAASLFDPHGWFGATITTAKIFLQQLWTLVDAEGKRLDWDTPLPPTVGENWRKYEEQLPVLNSIRFARCVVIPNAEKVELHCFSDASKKAYGGCVYVRSENAAGDVMVRLVASKSRVAPLKVQTIPRLELCGATLVAQLFKVLQEALDISLSAHFWTDSTCVLSWLDAIPTTWATFVANRVSKIQTITEGHQWKHVPGVQNPADLISRGIMPNDIVDNLLWWNGPPWLALGREHWPNSTATVAHDEVETERRHTAVAIVASNLQEFTDYYLSKFETYPILIRRTAIWLRLMKNLPLPDEERSRGFITSAELRQAEYVLIRRVQKEVFAEEWKALSASQPLPKKSPLRWYHPYIDRDQILRVGGRLTHSEEGEETKHPAVLPARHQLTRMILQHYHMRLLHAGPQLLLDRYLQALRRFIGRRGRPAEIWSDNGTNFVGGKNRLQELFALMKDSEHKEKVAKEFADQGIRWIFSPPSAPHFGGLWEAAVRSAKHHLLRVLGEETLAIEDMTTLLVQVESCMNSRPITQLSDDPNDLEPLTPGHFLVTSSLQSLPDPSYLDVPTNRLNYWQQVQRKVQEFWRRWKRDYLSQLQSRTKRLYAAVPIEVGRLVVVVDDNLPPIRWKLGRIHTVHPGDDGVVRVVTLKTASGFLKRPVEKLCLLPRQDEQPTTDSTEEK